MPARVVFWVSGFALGVVAGAAVPESLFPGARPVVFGSVFLISGVLAEVVAGATAPAAATPRDLRPADGRVDVAPVAGVRRAPNPADPRFGAFVGLDGSGLGKFTPPAPARRSPPLLGRVVLASLFVGRDGRAWSAGEVAEAHRVLGRAAGWVEAQAARFGAAVNLELADTYFVFDDAAEDEIALAFAPEGDDVGPLEEGATAKALYAATRAAVALGFGDAQDLFRAVAARVGADLTVWLMHPRQAGRSFAVPVEDSALMGVSLAVCYARESSFPEPLTGPARPDPVTLVHELLHLFGATDKYGQPLRSFAPRSVSSREVMRLSETRLSRLRIDPFTAAEIGWGR